MKHNACCAGVVDMLCGGIENIHANRLIHGHHHGGNLLVENEPDSVDTCRGYRLTWSN